MGRAGQVPQAGGGGRAHPRRRGAGGGGWGTADQSHRSRPPGPGPASPALSSRYPGSALTGPWGHRSVRLLQGRHEAFNPRLPPPPAASVTAPRALPSPQKPLKKRPRRLARLKERFFPTRNVIFHGAFSASQLQSWRWGASPAPGEAGRWSLWGPRPGTSLRRWRDAGPEGSLRPGDLPYSTPRWRLYLPENFWIPENFPLLFFFFPGSRDPSINSWNTNKITKIYTFSPSCGSGIGKRSLRYCICKHDVQVQTTQLDLQLYVHCWHSKDANLQVVYKKDCPGHLCISRSADACNYTHIKGICIFLAHPSSENKRNFRK